MKEKKSFKNTIAAFAIKSVKLFKLFKFGKIAITFLSMLISVLVYAFALGPLFAVAFVAMLFIHEMGHIIALRYKGYQTSGPIFIPMLGAVIAAPEFKSANDEAFIGFGGPLLGGIAGLLVFAFWFVTGSSSPLLLIIAYITTFLNVFNLVPLRPLDGGRILCGTGPWMQWIGVIVLLGMSIVLKDASILLIWIIVLGDLSIPKSLKFYSALVCWVLMGYLASLNKEWVVLLVDVPIGLIFVAVYAIQSFRLDTEIIVERMIMSKASRVRWVAAYLTISSVLLWAMMTQKRYLPDVHHHAKSQIAVTQ